MIQLPNCSAYKRHSNLTSMGFNYDIPVQDLGHQLSYQAMNMLEGSMNTIMKSCTVIAGLKSSYVMLPILLIIKLKYWAFQKF